MGKSLWYRLEISTGTKEAARLRQRGSLKGTNGLGFGAPVAKPVPMDLLNRG